MLLAMVAVLAFQAPPVAVEQRLADRYGLRVGDTVEISSGPTDPRHAFVVSAIYKPLPDPATALRGEFHTRLHLPDLARLIGFPDRVDQFAVKIRPGITPESVATRLNQTAFGYRAYPSHTIAEESSRTFLVVSRFHRAIGFIAIIASAIFLLCIMLLKVEERRLDAAVMRMVGIGRRTILLAVVLEACLVAVVGSAVGVVLARVSGVITNAVYQRRFETELTFAYLTPGIVMSAVAISLGLGVATGVLAALRLVRQSPLALWRRA